MSIVDRLIGAFGAKAAPARRIAGFAELGRPVWTPRDYGALAREGYARNPVVYRCVNMIAEAVASVPLVAKVRGRELLEHPLLALLARPNPREAGPTFLHGVVGHLMIAGNAYVEALIDEGRVSELHALRPDRMRVVPGDDGWPAAYDYTVGARTTRLPMEGAVPPVLHLALFHPTNDHYGLAPLEAAAVSLDVLNAASAWHKALLDNAARPSGALVYAPASGANLSREQFERLKEELETTFQGAANAGRPMLLEGGLDWKALSLSPKDLDFVQAKNGAAREVALAFGVPPLMLGLPGDATFANYQEANRAFWRQTALPLASRIARAVAHWLAPARGEVDLAPDVDAVEALHDEREALWRRVGGAGFLSDDEKREAVGYGRSERS
jgi:HK97 family phage portal protein